MQPAHDLIAGPTPECRDWFLGLPFPPGVLQLKKLNQLRVKAPEGRRIKQRLRLARLFCDAREHTPKIVLRHAGACKPAKLLMQMIEGGRVGELIAVADAVR